MIRSLVLASRLLKCVVMVARTPSSNRPTRAASRPVAALAPHQRQTLEHRKPTPRIGGREKSTGNPAHTDSSGVKTIGFRQISLNAVGQASKRSCAKLLSTGRSMSAPQKRAVIGFRPAKPSLNKCSRFLEGGPIMSYRFFHVFFLRFQHTLPFYKVVIAGFGRCSYARKLEEKEMAQ